jgi:predicted HTH domain antitoxin
MPRKSHDFFAKEWMKELLAEFGEVTIERAVASEVRTIDLVFLPHSDRLADLKSLGLLGRMLSQLCPIEFFRNAVPTQQIANCREKNADLRSEFIRVAAQQKQVLKAKDLPNLWIVTPTLSPAKQEEFCMVTKPQWGEGIYFLPKNDFTRIVVVHQLPVTLDTFWVRLLGRDQVQARAVQELLALREDYPYRRETLRHLASLQVNLPMRHNRSRDLREVMMNLAPAYEQWHAEIITEGEERRAIKIARRLLQKNTPLQEIAELTELSLEQIQALQAEARS